LTALPTLTTRLNYPIFTATLVVETNDSGAGLSGKLSLPVTMTILARPMCDFTTNAPVDVGQVITFTNATRGSSPIEYDWDFGDGSVHSTLVHPTHSYARRGGFTVTLTAANALGVDMCSQRVIVGGRRYLPLIIKFR
jgi:PKD repeat protein